jgi:antitoxin (DNA-binding transcriptional repressor) of toxin-antitoxin stability system
MDEMPISKFKATCLATLERVRRTGRPLRITRFGKPIADIQAPTLAPKDGWLGSMSESGTIAGDLVAPPDVTWDALR